MPRCWFGICPNGSSIATEKHPDGVHWTSERVHDTDRPSPTWGKTGRFCKFAEAISMNKRYRECKECGQWFEIPLRGARISREYCSTGCRSKAYRERQQRAYELHTQGKSFKEIKPTVATHT